MRRKWDKAKTPFERVKATGKLNTERQEQLQALYEQTNPHYLREAIYQGLAQRWEQRPSPASEAA